MPGFSSAETLAFHDKLRLEAKDLYVESQIPSDRAADWREALTESRKLIIEALRASVCLTDIEGALASSGRHMLVFRHLTAPPVSQDQFKLICKPWPKSSENSGASVQHDRAVAVAESFRAWFSPRLAPWLKSGRTPELREIYALMLATAPLMADKRVATARRNRLARVQEGALIDLLVNSGWTQVASRPVDKQGALELRQFMHKAKFASGETSRAEVDVALGLRNGIVLALECKVTNDETNSIKRIDDISKKAQAWRARWGNYMVQPAALMQGVMKMSDVKRLLDEGIHVFWSHRLNLFEDWLSTQIDD